jgi:hypothetical protein
VPKFVQHAHDAVPAIDEDGDQATVDDRALASAAVQTAADVLARWYVNYGGKGLGLHGGSWSFNQPEQVARYALRHVRWAADLPVSGSVIWDQRDGSIAANLTFGASHVVAKWNDRDDQGTAVLSGIVSGRKLVAAMPAP